MRVKAKVAISTLLVKARNEAEQECGYKFDDKYAIEVLRYCMRKLKRIGQTEEYLPLLYRCELIQHQQMKRITEASNPIVMKGASLCVSIA